jgi:hypothetical protein
MAHQKGKATDPVKYFADPQNRDLGIIKQKRKPNIFIDRKLHIESSDGATQTIELKIQFFFLRASTDQNLQMPNP